MARQRCSQSTSTCRNARRKQKKNYINLHMENFLIRNGRSSGHGLPHGLGRGWSCSKIGEKYHAFKMISRKNKRILIQLGYKLNDQRLLLANQCYISEMETITRPFKYTKTREYGKIMFKTVLFLPLKGL